MPTKVSYRGVNLGGWLARQRYLAKRKELSPARKRALESAGALRPGRRTSFKMGADGRPEPLPDPMGDIRRLTVGKQPEEPDSPTSPMRSPASRKTSTWCARIPPPPLRAQPARALG